MVEEQRDDTTRSRIPRNPHPDRGASNAPPFHSPYPSRNLIWRGIRLRRAAGVLDVGGEEFFIDLLFYHLKLRCYVVIELKAGRFKPEHLGQLSFYLTAVNAQIKHPDDRPTIGLLLCKTKNKVVAEYQLVESLPAEFQTSLPSIEQIECELAGGILNDSEEPA